MCQVPSRHFVCINSFHPHYSWSHDCSEYTDKKTEACRGQAEIGVQPIVHCPSLPNGPTLRITKNLSRTPSFCLKSLRDPSPASLTKPLPLSSPQTERVVSSPGHRLVPLLEIFIPQPAHRSSGLSPVHAPRLSHVVSPQLFQVLEASAPGFIFLSHCACCCHPCSVLGSSDGELLHCVFRE